MPSPAQPSEPLYRLIAEAAPNAIVVVDHAGQIVLVNAQTERLFGYPREELLGQAVEMLVPERLREAHVESRAEFLARPSARPMGARRELFGRRKDGTEFPVEIGLNPLDAGQGTLVLSAIVDITERKQLEDELHRRVQELAAADRHKDEFLAILGHELRNPLAPLRNALHILGMPGVDAGTVRKTHEMMGRQMEQLVRLVDDVLDVSRIIMGRVELRKEPVDLSVAVSRGVESAQLALANHELVVSPSREPVLVDADLVRLSQVIANILTNAAKYTPRGGRIEVRVEPEGPQGTVRVRDDGIGIASELLPHVFDLFVRADSPLVRSQPGLGLGLTLVKRAVEMHGGSVTASSPGPGRGSEFVVRLPLSVREDASRGLESASPTAAPPLEKGAGHKRVLVVDDNVDAAESIGFILRGYGCDVRCAHTGGSALDMAEAYRPEVIVLDIGLPDVTGYEVARRLRERPQFSRTRLVAVTGYGQDADRARSTEAGIDYHLTKPVDPQILQLVVVQTAR